MANVYISDRDTYKISGEEIPVNEVQNRIKTLDTDKPFLLGSHEDPEIVKWFMQYKNA